MDHGQQFVPANIDRDGENRLDNISSIRGNQVFLDDSRPIPCVMKQFLSFTIIQIDRKGQKIFVFD